MVLEELSSATRNGTRGATIRAKVCDAAPAPASRNPRSKVLRPLRRARKSANDSTVASRSLAGGSEYVSYRAGRAVTRSAYGRSSGPSDASRSAQKPPKRAARAVKALSSAAAAASSAGSVPPTELPSARSASAAESGVPSGDESLVRASAPFVAAMRRMSPSAPSTVPGFALDSSTACSAAASTTPELPMSFGSASGFSYFPKSSARTSAASSVAGRCQSSAASAFGRSLRPW